MVTKIPAADRIPSRASQLVAEWHELYRRNLIDQVERAQKAIEKDITDPSGKRIELSKDQWLVVEDRRAVAEASAHLCAWQKTIGEIAIRYSSIEQDFTIVKMLGETVARRYDDVVDERLVPSVLAQFLLDAWDDCDCEYPNPCSKGHGLSFRFPEHEREERKKRLERYIDMMRTLEDKYDHGKINPVQQ